VVRLATEQQEKDDQEQDESTDADVHAGSPSVGLRDVALLVGLSSEAGVKPVSVVELLPNVTNPANVQESGTRVTKP
jgi:hypothetical protein